MPRCYYCGAFLLTLEEASRITPYPLSYPYRLERDHIQSRRDKGSDDPVNLVDACRACNWTKNADSVECFRALLAKRHKLVLKDVVFFGEGGEYEDTIIFSAAAMQRWQNCGDIADKEMSIRVTKWLGDERGVKELREKDWCPQLRRYPQKQQRRHRKVKRTPLF
jgi:HNH endonuclease